MKTEIKNGVAILFVLISILLSTYVAEASEVMIDSIATDSISNYVNETVVQDKSFFSIENIVLIVTALYELVIRIYPTAKDYSILSAIFRVFNFLVPNFKKQGGQH